MAGDAAGDTQQGRASLRRDRPGSGPLSARCTAFLSVTAAAQVDYRSFHRLNLGADCFRGRVVIIRDAAHVCPPTLAQGAAMALEDAAVLAEMLVSADKLDDDLRGERHD